MKTTALNNSPMNTFNGEAQQCFLGVKSEIDRGQTIFYFYPNHDPKHIVVITLEPTAKSQPSPTISYTNNKRLEGLRCCEGLE
eukprot:scaffold5286_cov38-Cyclotella_meneghiniana.AAC.1